MTKVGSRNSTFSGTILTMDQSYPTLPLIVTYLPLKRRALSNIAVGDRAVLL